MLTSWTLLTNHALALVCLARDPDMRLRDVADCLGVTERAAHRIVTELCQAGYVSKERVGARNHYRVDLARPLRHPLLADHDAREVIEPLVK